MHLLFLYIKNYKVLKNCSMNFDSRYHFSYENKVLTLDFAEPKILPDNFYRIEEESEGVVDCISAIIGANGSWKTSLAVFLQDMMKPSRAMGEFVAVFGELKHQGITEYSIYCRVERDLKTKKPLIQFNNFGDMPKCYLWPDYTTNFEQDLRMKFRLIYYSPLFSTERVFGERQKLAFDEEPRDIKGYAGGCDDLRRYAIRDISVTGQLCNLLDDDTYSRGSWAPLIYERKRVIEFLSEVASDEVLERSLELPVLAKNNALSFVFLENDLHETLEPTELDIDRTRLPLGKIDIEGVDVFEFFGIMNTKYYSESAVIKAFYLYANSCFREFALGGSGDADLKAVVSWLRRKGAVVSRRTLRRVSIRSIEAYLIKSCSENDGRRVGLETLGIFLEYLRSFASVTKGDSDGCRWNVAFSARGTQSYNLYLKMMEAYFELRRKFDFCAFGFKNILSSGEMIYVSMWARLYRAVKDMRYGKGGHKSAILFMDEAETAMHPQWQRELVLRMLRLWSRMMTPDMHLQVIFGSHSPMLLSDIPKGNVTFLGDSKDLEIMRSIDNTFGANIFDLYRSSFFMKDGPIGAFASKKIDSLLEALRGDREMNAEEKASLAKLIGDPFVGRYVRSCIS